MALRFAQLAWWITPSEPTHARQGPQSPWPAAAGLQGSRCRLPCEGTIGRRFQALPAGRRSNETVAHAHRILFICGSRLGELARSVRREIRMPRNSFPSKGRQRARPASALLEVAFGKDSGSPVPSATVVRAVEELSANRRQG
mgnify:CR=1 FL=1